MTEMKTQSPQLSFAEACDRGKVREENQDHVRHVGTSLGELVIVADGIGGYRGGAVASRMVVEGIEEWFNNVQPGTSPAQAIAEAAAHANMSIMEAAAGGDPLYSRMGSTVVLALIARDEGSTQAWIGHIGDSRAYLCRGGQLERLTRDHSAVQVLIDQGALDPADARRHPDASVLLRSLGHEAQSEIEMSLVTLEERDTILLCSDGLWGYVPEDSIESVLCNPEIDIDAAAQGLLDLALNAGGPDNIGIELVRVHAASVHEETVPAAMETEQPANQHAPTLSKTMAYVLGFVVAGALLGWVAQRQHWIPEIHLLPHSQTDKSK